MLPAPAVPWQRLPADLAAAMRPGLAGAVAAVTAEIAALVTAAAPDAHADKLRRDAGEAVRAGFEGFLDLAGTAGPALAPGIREVFVALGAAEAREDRGPEILLAALRTASRRLLRLACESLARIGPVTTDALVDLSEAVSAYVDELAAASTDGFAHQLREQAGEGERRRQHLADLLLRGGAPRSVVVAAAAAAGWPVPGAVVPVLLPPEQARDARFRFRADGVVAERARDAVLLLPAGPRTARTRLAETLAGRNAVVGPSLDWPHLPEAVRLAELAGDLTRPEAPGDGREARAAAGHAAPVFADDHLATLALRGVPGALAVLATRRLAPLARLRAAQRDCLLATLRSWLRHWGSRAAVSAELYVHPQTVSYRLRRLRHLLGDDLDDPTARYELLLVLAAGAPDAGTPPGARALPGAGVSPVAPGRPTSPCRST